MVEFVEDRDRQKRREKTTPTIFQRAMPDRFCWEGRR
jgi:hypothetical protein